MTSPRDSSYIKEVKRYLRSRPKSASNDLVSRIPQLAPGQNVTQRKRDRSAEDTNRKSSSNQVLISSWSPVPANADNGNTEGNVKKWIMAYRNGERLCGVWLSAKSFRGFLIKATVKLRLPRPARRIFCEHGIEAHHVDHLPHGTAVFISMGEDYKGPQLSTYQIASGRVEYSEKLYGRMNRKSVTSETRLNEMMGNTAKRILILRIGDSLPDGDLSEVAVEVHRKGWLRSLYVQATTRLGMSAYARQAYNWNGQLITKKEHLPLLPQAVLGVIIDGKAYGPIWIGCGEAFNANAAADFCTRLLKRIKYNLKIRKSGIDISEEERQELIDFKPKLSETIDQLLQMPPNDVPVRTPSASTRFECLRLKVFENGHSPQSEHFRTTTFPLSDIKRRSPGLTESALLEALHAYIGESSSGKKIRRLYTEEGVLVESVRILENDQSVWCSGGEPFASFEQPVLAFGIDILRVYGLSLPICEEYSSQLEEEERFNRRLAVRESLAPYLQDLVFSSKNRSEWMVLNKWAVEIAQIEEEIEDKARTGELIARSTSLHCSVVQTPISRQFPVPIVLGLSLLIEPDANTGGMKSEQSQFSQKWIIDSKGYIRPRLFPQLCLGVDISKEIEVEIAAGGKKYTVSGSFRVILTKTQNFPENKWKFSSDSRIESQWKVSESQSTNFTLTFLGNKEPFQRVSMAVAVCPRQKSTTLAVSQQWAMRPTACWELRPRTPKNINPKWHARALWWPTVDYKFDGGRVSVVLVANAPPIYRSQGAGTLDAFKKRIFVLQNGCDDLSRAIPIVVNDSAAPHCYPVSFDSFDQPKRDITVRHFMSYCTSLLNLPSAARRMFNTNGIELFDLFTVESDQLLYISTGENFVNMIVSEEQRRSRFFRQLLNADTAKVRSYKTLHSQSVVEMVVGYEGTAGPGTRLVILPISNEGDVAVLTARSGESESSQTGNTVLTVGEGLSQRKFQYIRFKITADGYLDTLNTASKSLCLTVDSKESLTREVTLQLRRPDDPLQQWSVGRDGLIRCRYQPRFVLAVQLPDVLTSSTSQFGSGVSPLVGSFVGVQQLHPAQFGRSNQLFRFDRSSGRLFPFNANQCDLDITAAMSAGICTGAVCNEIIDQMGYELENPQIPRSWSATDKASVAELTVCIPCARAIRGSGCPLKKIPRSRDFKCALSDDVQRRKFFAVCGTSGSSLAASIRTLYTVDLSGDSTAESILTEWEHHLFGLIKSRQVGPDLAPPASVVNQPLVWVLARAVATGVETGPPPVLVAGRSISEILLQCTQKLALAFAARKMYAVDGVRFVDCHAIFDWIAENKDLVEQRARILAAKRCPDILRLMQPDDYGQVSPVESVFWALPVEVWVSDGKTFQNPHLVDKRVTDFANRFKSELPDAWTYDTERKKLTGIEARRKQTMFQNNFVGTEDPRSPVALEGGWKARAAEEVVLSQKLSTTPRRPRSTTPRTAEAVPLGAGAIMRILAYENGGNPDDAVYVWGASLDELLRNSTTRLNLRRPAKRLFLEDGTEMSGIEDLRGTRDHTVAVSTGLAFISSKAAKSAVSVKAEWIRQRREFGPSATDMPVAASDLAAQASARSAARIEEMD